MKKIIKILKLILIHPMNNKNKIKALTRFIRWQFAVRLLPEAQFILPFADGPRLLMRRGSTGATGNWYSGLDEFEDMSFVLHVLRPGDLFVDIGANIGSYSIIAASCVGSSVIAVEPIAATYQTLKQNIFLNDLSDLVSPMNIGISSHEGELKFTSDFDTTNHVTDESELERAESVYVSTLDNLCNHQNLTIIKVDCEGYELEVLRGAKLTLQNQNLLAVILELNGSGKRYGFSDEDVDKIMLDNGFYRYSYLPFDRKLIQLHNISRTSRESQNILYIRDVNVVKLKLKSAPVFKINNILI